MGDLDLAFKRVYYNPWGKHQEYQDSNDRPFKNNIGSGWRHNFNVHVRLSTENGMAYYMDANNNYKKFERSQEDVNGYDIYIPMPQGNYHVLTEELSVVMRRNVNDGTVIIEFPQGNTCHFSAPINDYERYCRLESFTDVSGNTFTLTYADLWLYGIDDVLDNFGRLSRVDAPCGDDRYLQFSYAGDLISKVELVKPSGTGTEVIKQVEYTYGPYQDGQQTPANFLRAVEVDDNVDDTVAFEYDQGEYDGQPVGMYPSKITDKEGNQLLVECEYGIMGTEDPSCIYMTLTYPNGLQTVLDKTAAYTTDIRNYDGQTALSRFEYIVDAHGLKVSQARYYPDPNGSTYNNWSYTYSFFNLTDISKLSVSYSYNSYGRVTVAQSGGVYFRYEYPSGGGLYPIRAYGPGTASENGPMTEFVYDTNDRIIQVKPPNMGADGISFEYDTRGRLITQTAADGTEQSYTYDDRGNRITYTDAENHTWTYTYDDLGRVATQTDPENQVTSYTYTGSCTSCSGASGQIASITMQRFRCCVLKLVPRP